MCVLLDYGLTREPMLYKDRHREPVVGMNECYEVGSNVFCVLLVYINNGKDLEELYRDFMRLSRKIHKRKNTLLLMINLPTRMYHHQELFFLLWKTLEEKPLFLDFIFILTRCNVYKIMTLIYAT